ncbi:MAG: hypothetical protein CMN30_10600 [Sandaracinus sp.]|nr:hypothetical protein [Sandaracinus sp.]
MPVIFRTRDSLHVHPLTASVHPLTSVDPKEHLFRKLGHGFHGTAPFTLDLDASDRLFWERRGVDALTPETIAPLTKYRFPLHELRRLIVRPHFPGFAIEVRGPGGFSESYAFEEPSLPELVAGPPTDEVRAYERSVADLWTEWHRERWGRTDSERGWLDLPAVAWDPAEWPARHADAVGYREAAGGIRILAERDAGSTWERFARALLPGGRRSPERVAITREGIFADFRGRVFWLPRGLPHWESADMHVFGRHAGFVLEERGAPCPVTRLLRGE